jgi:hypothetical protein
MIGWISVTAFAMARGTWVGKAFRAVIFMVFPLGFCVVLLECLMEDTADMPKIVVYITGQICASQKFNQFS